LLQIRKNTRLRREYLYKKSLESKERTIFDRKQRIKEAIESKLDDKWGALNILTSLFAFFFIEGQPIPTELRNAGDEMRSDLPFDQAQAGVYFCWKDW
jgi:U3 small nucleolar ribonucleoprotein protein IMP4